MKLSTCLFISFFCLLTFGCRENLSEAQIIEEVLTVENIRREALQNNQIDIIDQTMHEGYRFLNPQGKILDKAAELAEFNKGLTKFNSFTTEDVEVRAFGQTAVVTGKAIIDGISDGHDISGAYQYTRVYHSEQGKWQIISSQFSPVNPIPHSHLNEDGEIVAITPDKDIIMPQGLPYFVGVSEKTAGSSKLSMNLIVIPPGAKAKAHSHNGYETAIYVLQGSAKTLYGAGLKKSITHKPGDFIYIPPGVPHQPVNLSQTEEALAIIARTSGSEEETVDEYPPKK